ncbi:hypothetical protein [Pseudooctadecabacter sp.]|uniref:hypothetical protein n=1 Tax=Pseudooctadecabacter sp. TaxID=1966338 RepID=UPI0025FF8964|nr:hypothetical protein [Pseudooctadecabacter sp.]
MKDISAGFQYDLSGLDGQTWAETLETVSEEYGFFEPVGPRYSAAFVEAGRTLLVSFESASAIQNAQADCAPLGWSFVQSHGWSSLTVLCEHVDDWFRHPAIFGFFDRMIDDGFFDDFDRILFYGAGPGGYAAAAFSVAAPDARVLAIQPQATLDVARAGWDRRFPTARRLDFTSRYGYAPQMVETASDVWIIHDPQVVEDAVHASLFQGDNIHHLSCPHLGDRADRSLMGIGIWTDLVEQAMSGDLTHLGFAHLWRARQDNLKYVRTLFGKLDEDGTHPRLLARLCRAMVEDANRPLFAQKLAELEAQGIAP